MELAHYASAIGILMYVMVYTRPDIANVVGVLSRYMLTLGKEHWIIVKIVFKYLCGTKYYVILYQGKLGGDNKLNVHGFVNADWVEDMDQWGRPMHICSICLVDQSIG
jgi:hypothetical protein